MNGFRWTYCGHCGHENGHLDYQPRPETCGRCGRGLWSCRHSLPVRSARGNTSTVIRVEPCTLVRSISSTRTTTSACGPR